MFDSSRYERIVVDRYTYCGFHNSLAWCRLEILALTDGCTVVFATEVKDNPGTSITNRAEHLATWVCCDFRIDPSRLVWIEHYGFPSAADPKRPRTYDLVSFEILPPGHDSIFAHPKWRPMRSVDWRELGLEPRI